MHLPSVLKGHKDKEEEPKEELQKEPSGEAGQSQQPEQQYVAYSSVRMLTNNSSQGVVNNH